MSLKKEVRSKAIKAMLVLFTLCRTVRRKKEQTRETGNAATASLKSENMDQARRNVGLIWFSGEHLNSGI